MIEDILKEKKNMTSSEERIADYMLEKKTLLRKQSSRSIASQLFINPSMITRFCQKLGFHGYTDFLEEYLKEIEYTESHFQNLDPNHPFDNQDKNTVIANKIGQLYHEIVDDTLKLISHDALQNAINCLNKSDIISIHAPLNNNTKGLINYDALSKMKNTAILVNMGRGPIVVERDLSKAIDEDKIRGAALDVFEVEPINEENPLLTVKNKDKLLLSPHIAWASIEARKVLFEEVIENIKAFYRGEERNRV